MLSMFTASGAWAADDTAGTTIETVVVTAERRAENEQDVPISLSAYSADDIVRQGITGVDQLAVRTPNFYALQQDELKADPPSIRGVTSSNTAGSDPAVAFYVDDVYMGNTVASNFDYFDLDRIEVLRGPQGTLFGRNATGGAVSITSRQPTFDPSGAADLILGNYDAVRVAAYYSDALTDNLAFKISGVFNERTGYVYNTFDGSHLKGQHDWSLRAQLLYKPTSNTEITFTLEHQDMHRLAGGYAILTPNPLFDGSTPSLAFNAFPAFSYKADWNTRPRESLDAWNASVRAVVHFNGFDLTAISGYHRHAYNSIFDTDGSPNSFVEDGEPEDENQFSQELRLTSTTPGRLDWVAGAFFYNENSLDKQIVCVGPDLIEFLTGTPGQPSLCAHAHGDQHTTSIAGYASGTFHVTDNLDISAAGRVTDDHKHIFYFQTDDTACSARSRPIAAASRGRGSPGTRTSPITRPKMSCSSRRWRPATRPAASTTAPARRRTPPSGRKRLPTMRGA